MAQRRESDSGEKPPIKARVLVLYTGGTIGMVPKEAGNPLSPLEAATKDDLLVYVPGLGENEGIHWDIVALEDDNENVVKALDSSDVDATHWCFMANAIQRAYDKYDGFVILHGTDTMAYTASGLSFLLQNLAKPVIITGSQLPIADSRSDAIQNLVNSLHIAGWKATGLPLVPEVTICFGDALLRGNRVRKMSSTSWQGFGTPNFDKLGKIGEHIKINEALLRPAANNAEAPFFVHQALETNVIDIGIFPGLKAVHLQQLLSLEGLRGIVLRTFGAGNAPSNKDFLDVIERAVDSGKVILNVTQCPEGMVEMGLYAASSALLERGVISGLDMTPEAALAKLMWILKTESGDEVQTQLQIDQRGEMTESLFDIRYGPIGTQSEPKPFAQASARAPGKFQKVHLSRAVLRISGIGLTETATEEEFELRVFLNLPDADSETPIDDPHLAATFRKSYSGQNDAVLIADVTTIVKRVVEDGRPIYVTVVPVNGKSIWYRGLYLALFAKA